MKLSIIIPTYNEENYIEKILTCLKVLTIEHEIIVTDDKSTDRTVEVARRHTSLVLVPEVKHRTIAANRNFGASKASGDFLVFLDADTYFEDPNQFFKNALSCFEKKPELVALTAALWVNPESSTLADRVIYTIFNWVHVIKNNVLGTGEASGKFQMIRRDAFEKVGGFRSDLVTREDADMFQRLAKIGKTYCDPEIRVLHSGRRARKIGWPKLLWIWMFESFKFAAFGKSNIKEWKAVR